MFHLIFFFIAPSPNWNAIRSTALYHIEQSNKLAKNTLETKVKLNFDNLLAEEIWVYPWISDPGKGGFKTFFVHHKAILGQKWVDVVTKWAQLGIFLEREHKCQLCHDVSAKFPSCQFTPRRLCLASSQNVLSQFPFFWRISPLLKGVLYIHVLSMSICHASGDLGKYGYRYQYRYRWNKRIWHH